MCAARRPGLRICRAIWSRQRLPCHVFYGRVECWVWFEPSRKNILSNSPFNILSFLLMPFFIFAAMATCIYLRLCVRVSLSVNRHLQTNPLTKTPDCPVVRMQVWKLVCVQVFKDNVYGAEGARAHVRICVCVCVHVWHVCALVCIDTHSTHVHKNLHMKTICIIKNIYIYICIYNLNMHIYLYTHVDICICIYS